MCSILHDKFCLIYKGSIFSSWVGEERPSLADKNTSEERRGFSIRIVLFIQKNNHCYYYYLFIYFYHDIATGPSWDWDLLVLSTAKPCREPWSLLQAVYKLKSHEKLQRGKQTRERGRDSLCNWQKVREEVSGRRKAGLLPWFPPSEYLPGWKKEIFGDSLPQILRIQTLTHTQSHALPPNFNGCIYVAEQGQPEAKLEVSCAAHPYYLLKHLQAGSRATLLILPGTKAQEYPEHVQGHQGQGTCQRNINGFQHHNQGNREQAFFLCSRDFQIQAWTDWGKRGARQDILVTRAKKSVCTRICRLWSGRNTMSWMRKALACSFACHPPP